MIFVRNPRIWAETKIEDLDLLLPPGHEDISVRKNCLQIWDRCLSIPYCAYRQKLFEISWGTWVATGMQVVRGGWKELSSCLPTLDPNDWIVPTDDDDWLHPDLGKLLEQESGDFVRWDSLVFFTAMEQGRVRPWGRNDLCSNNFAIRAAVLQRLDPLTLMSAIVHSKADGVRREQNWKTSILQRSLSCYNIHPGSAHLIFGLPGRGSFLKVLPIAAGLEVPKKEYSWVTTYCEKMIELLAGIQRNKTPIITQL